MYDDLPVVTCRPGATCLDSEVADGSYSSMSSCLDSSGVSTKLAIPENTLFLFLRPMSSAMTDPATIPNVDRTLLVAILTNTISRQKEIFSKTTIAPTCVSMMK